MQKNLYNYIPAILLLLGEIIICLTLFLIDKYFNYYRDLIWISFAIIQIMIVLIYGILIKNLYKQIQTDMLTGLCSRRYFYTKLSKMKFKAPVSLILIDLDNFKSINDTYGHKAGDQVLRQFAAILKSNLREKDIIARWGGEEFAVILLQTDVDEAFIIGDRIRNSVENHDFLIGKKTCGITISIGLSSTKERTHIDMENLIIIADKALYKAKEKKNFIVAIEGFKRIS